MPIFVPAEPYPKKANDNIRSSDWNAAINEVTRLSDTTQYLGQNTFNGPLTVTGLLTASAGLTVNNVLLTANKGLTVTGGLLTASAGLTVTGDETVSGKLTVNGTALSELKGPVTVSGLLTASNGLTVNGALLTANAGLTVSSALTANGGIKGPTTANGDLTITNSAIVAGSFMSISETTVLSTNRDSGPWASFGSNAYYHANTWKLAKTNEPGVCLRMSGQGGGNSEFRFARVQAGATTATDLATIGTGGLTLTGALTVNGTASSAITGPLTVGGLLTASNGLTVNGTLLRANAGLTVTGALTVTGNQTVSGTLTVTGALTASSGITGPLTVSGLLTASNGLTVNGALLTANAGLTVSSALTANGGIKGPTTANGDLTITNSAIVAGSFMSISETTVLATNVTGQWASFGSNAYFGANGWRLAKAAQAGVSLVMSSQGGASRQFAFCKMDANSTTATDLVTIGTTGLTVTGALAASNGLTVNGAVLTAGAGLTVTGNQTVSGTLTVNGTALSQLKGTVTVSGLLTANNGLTVTGVLGVSTYTRISQQSGNWAVFGANMYSNGSAFKLVDTAFGGANLHMSGHTTGGEKFAFCLMDAGETNQRNIATLGTGGLKVSGGISGMNGPLTVNGALTVTGDLTASAGLTVTGNQTVGGTLTLTGAVTANAAVTVSGTLTASGGINGPITVNGLLTAGAGLTVTGDETVSGKLTVNGTARISRHFADNWAVFGANMYSDGNTFQLGNTAFGGANLHMSGQTTGGHEFSFAVMAAGETHSRNIATIGTGGLKVKHGISGLDGPLTINDSFMSIDGRAVISTSLSNGPWACFGSNAYYRATAFHLVSTNEPGVCFYMSGGPQGGNSEFRFARVEANSTTGTNLVTMGREGLTVSGKLTVNGTALSELKGPVTVSGLLTASAGLTVTGNQTVSGTLTVTGAVTANAALTVSGLLRASGGISGPTTANSDLTITHSAIVAGSFLSIEGLAVVSTNVGSGRWASFGSNLYYRGNQWSLATAAQPGVCLKMSALQDGNREFCFVRAEANAASSAKDLVTIGRQGIIVDGSKRVTTAGEFLYMVRGLVNSNGTVDSGTGFSVQKIGTGLYQINFNPAFSGTPTAVVNQVGTEVNNTLDNALVVGQATNWIKVKVGTPSGNAEDRPFTFIAVGPRN